MEKIESFFKFQITQTTNVLLYKIKMGDGRRWGVEGSAEEGRLILRQLDRSENNIEIKVDPGVLMITTVHGYEYTVTDREGDGADVSFHGPVNALLTQSLLPRMTYVPETLFGMSSDMDDFVPIDEFMELREKRHDGQVNPQDRFGWRVNMKFDNELVPWLPPFKAVMRDKQADKRKSGKFARR